MINFKYLINYIRTNICYTYFLVMQLIVGMALLIYVLHDPVNNLKDQLVFLIEWILVLFMILDIGLRISAQRKRFFLSLWNIIDLITVILILIVISFFYFLEMNNISTISFDDADIFGVLLLIFRYIIQMIRTIIVIKESKQINELKNQEINFEIDLKSMEKETNHTKDFYLAGTSRYLEKDKEKMLEGI